MGLQQRLVAGLRCASGCIRISSGNRVRRRPQSRSARSALSRRTFFEPLEDRRMLANFPAIGASTVAQASSAPSVPVVELSMSGAERAEGGSNSVTVTASISGVNLIEVAAAGPYTVPLDVTGTGITSGDFSLSDATITIPRGSLSGSVTLTVLDDDVVEARIETAILSISNPSGGLALGATTTREVSILDNDSATVSLSGSTASEDSESIGFTVELSAPVDVPVTVYFGTQDGTAVDGTDFMGVADQAVIFAALSTSKIVSVDLIDNVALGNSREFQGVITAIETIDRDVTHEISRLSRHNSVIGDVQRDFVMSPDGATAIYLAEETPFVSELFAVPIGGGRVTKLNGALAPGGEVSDFLLSADGSTVVYRADQDTDGVVELYGVPIDRSSAPTKLTNPLMSDRSVLTYMLTSDGSRVVYRADQDTDNIFELYVAPTDGSSAPIKLNDQLAPGEHVRSSFVLGANGRRVFYLAHHDAADAVELHSVAIDSSSASTKLNGQLTPGGNVLSFAVSEDGNRIVYLADQDTDRIAELYGVPTDGSSAPIKLNEPLVAGGRIVDYKFSPAGSRVVYKAEQDTDNVFELYSVPNDRASVPIKLSGQLVMGGDVAEFSVTSSHVVYLADQDTDLVGEVYSVPIDGSSESVKVNNQLPQYGRVFDFSLSADGSRIVYRADQATYDVIELYSVPTDRSSAPVKLNEPLVQGGNIGAMFSLDLPFRIAADSSQVVYLADQDTDGVDELYSVPIDRSSAPTKLNDPLVSGGRVAQFSLGADGTSVLYRGDQSTENVFELYSVPINRTSVPIKLNSQLALGGVVQPDFKFSVDGARAVYRSGGELYSAHVDGSSAPTRLNNELVSGGSVSEFTLSADGHSVVYLADQATANAFDLYSVPIDGSSSATKLNAQLVSGGRVISYELTSDGSRVIYRATQDSVEAADLYSVPTDGTSTPTKLNGQLVSGGTLSTFAITSNGSHVVYRADQDINDVFELYSVPTDGSSPPAKLNDQLVSGGDVSTFRLSTDGRWVVYRANPDTVHYFDEIYSVPIDRSSSPKKLNDESVQSGFVLDFTINADGSRVVYLADHDTKGVYEVYSVPTDGSSEPVKLNDQLVLGGSVSLVTVSADGSRVVYQADRDTDDVFDLYRVPIDGSSAPLKLSDQSSPSEYAIDVRISPGGDRVVYQPVRDVDSSLGTYQEYHGLNSVPMDGSEMPTNLVGQHEPVRFELSADGTRVVYLATQADDSGIELYSVPIDGSFPPIRLNDQLVVGGNVQGTQSGLGRTLQSAFTLSSDGSQVIYRADQETDDTFELYRVPVGGGSVTKVHTTIARFAKGVPDFASSPDESTVVYRVEEAPGIVDLFGTALVTAATATITDEAKLDYGDAPAMTDTGFANSYPVTLAENGARHRAGTLLLGAEIDIELDGQPSAGADGDDNVGILDEDGVFVIASPLATTGTSTRSSIAVTVSADAVAGGTGKLDAWIDFDQSGSWEPGEQVFDTVDLEFGLNVRGFTVPAGATSGTTVARFRLSSTGGLGPTGAASDGEVEDHLVTLFDGDAPTASNVAIDMPSPGTIDLFVDGSDLVAKGAEVELYRAPRSSLGRIDIAGSGGDDTINIFAETDSFTADAGAGHDTLRLGGSEQRLDLTQIDDANIQGFEKIDITGTGDNRLVLDVAEVIKLAANLDTLRVNSDEGDEVSIGTGWQFDGTIVDNGDFIRVLTQGDATLHQDGPFDWTYPETSFDVNGNGSVEPLDALLIFNELNDPRFSDRAGGRLHDAATLDEFPNFFYDASPDGFVVPLDALVVINFLNDRIRASEGEAVGSGRFADEVAFLPPADFRAGHLDLRLITMGRKSSLPKAEGRRTGVVRTADWLWQPQSSVDDYFVERPGENPDPARVEELFEDPDWLYDAASLEQVL